jgi:hypothetical protein
LQDLVGHFDRLPRRNIKHKASLHRLVWYNF